MDYGILRRDPQGKVEQIGVLHLVPGADTSGLGTVLSAVVDAYREGRAASRFQYRCVPLRAPEPDEPLAMPTARDFDDPLVCLQACVDTLERTATDFAHHQWGPSLAGLLSLLSYCRTAIAQEQQRR